ncbi:MAG: hypothetical protein IJM24_02120 [Clostridia bacterium]|nr:hypothetical protein [Clostridia bacterium]
MRNAAAGNKKNRRKRPLTAAAAAAVTAALALTALLSGCGKIGRPGAQFGEIIAAGRTAEAELVPYIHCPPAGEYAVAQGAATDGEFVYFLMRTSANGNGIICKYSLKTRKFAGQSEPIYVFHGNDMTYDSAKKLLYIAHGSTEGKILTAVDPDTLTVTEQSIDIEKGAGAITYSPARDRFAISQGGKSLHFFDGELNWLESFDRLTGTGYTAQGMGSDEQYIFFPMSGGEDNILQVYDWEGNYTGVVHIPTGWESESMFWTDGTYYVNFNHDGATLCRLVFR